MKRVQKSFKVVTYVEVSKVFQASFEWVSRKLKEVREFQEAFQKILRGLMEVSRGVLLSLKKGFKPQNKFWELISC